MPDYPAHLATFYLLSGGAFNPLLAHFYRVEWTFVPNLAAEAIVPLLAHVMSLVAATKLFLSLYLALWVSGAAAIHRALYGRLGAIPLAAGFFAYNANFMWGFFNYCFAMALAFLTFASWISRSERRPWLHLAQFSAAVTVVYFCHVFAAATLLLMLGCYEAAELLRRRPLPRMEMVRRAAFIGAIGAPSAVAFIFLKPTGTRTQDVQFNLVDTFVDRVSSAVQYTFDRPAYFLLFGLTAFFLIALWKRKIAVHRQAGLLLAVLVVASLLAPEWAMGGWGVDLRLPAVLGALSFAVADFRCGKATMVAFSCICIALLTYQAGALAGNWRYYDRQFAEFRVATKTLAPGSRILTVLDGDAMGLAADQPYWHMAEYAIIDRAAFTPLLFTTRGQHVIALRPNVQNIGARSAQQGSPPDISELEDLAAGSFDDDPDIRNVFPYLLRFQCHFDDAVVIHLNGRRSPVPDMLSLRHAGSFFALYRIEPNGSCGRS